MSLMNHILVIKAAEHCTICLHIDYYTNIYHILHIDSITSHDHPDVSVCQVNVSQTPNTHSIDSLQSAS